MDKPISIILEELKQEIADSINKSQLPLAIVEPIMKDLCNEITIMARQQLTKDKEEYEKNQKEETKE